MQVSVPFNMMFPSGIALAGGLDKTSGLSARGNQLADEISESDAENVIQNNPDDRKADG